MGVSGPIVANGLTQSKFVHHYWAGVAFNRYKALLRYIRGTRQIGVRWRMNLQLGIVGSEGSLPLIIATRCQSQCTSNLTTENACTTAF